MENYKTAISCDAGNIQINETHIKCEIHAVHKYVGNLSKTFESEFNTFFHEMMISNQIIHFMSLLQNIKLVIVCE